MNGRLASAVLLGTALIVVSGCGRSTKSGGTAKHEITLVMQTPDAPDADAEYFIQQVKERTNGRVKIVEGTDYSSSDPDNEARLVRALRSGKERMAYIPSRAWERASSVHAFRALQAPFLVTDYGLLGGITTGAVGRSMLISLDRIGIVGLGLVANELRRPLGREPLDSAVAFRGARIRVVTSTTSIIALSSLGAVPLTHFTSGQVSGAIARGTLVGVESSTKSISDNGYVRVAPYLPANLALFAKTQTIAIRKAVFERLSAHDQAALRAAAAATVAQADPAAQERREVRQLCDQGLRLVRAKPADLAALRREAAPAYALLERDASTRTEIRAIERLKQEVPTTAASLPACPSRSAKGGHAVVVVGIAGTYVMNISRAEMEAHGLENWGFTRLVLGKRRFRISDRRAPGQLPLVQGSSSGWTSGTYSIRGNRLTFFIGNGSGDTPLGKLGDTPIVVRWSLYRNTLTLQQGKKNEGGAGLWLKPWRRIS